MGSDSDLATMKAAAAVLDDFGVPCEVTVVSAHRTPDRMLDYARSAAGRGLKVPPGSLSNERITFCSRRVGVLVIVQLRACMPAFGLSSF